MASSDRDRNERHKIAASVKHIPKDAQVIMSILKELGINDYEHRVINQLLEFTYRYVTCILDDAKIFANHAKKKMIDLDDVKIASEMILDKTFTSPPPREVLLELVRSRSAPLPPIKPHCGLRLPPDRYCLIAANYKLRPSSNAKKVLSKSALPSQFDNRNTTNKPPFPSKVTSSSASVFQSPTTTNITSKRPPLSIANKTQTVSVPKPVFKFSTTPKTTPTTTGNIKPPDVKMAVDDDGIVVSGIKRKRDDDDEFETV